jgi:hypothetical protein
MKVTMLLADAAQAVEGKLFVLGGGWSVCGPGPAPMALALKIEVPWDSTNQRHQAVFELLDVDGNPVMAPAADEGADEVPIVITADFEVGRPVGVKPGSPLDMPMAINIGPIPLEPGQRYEWRLAIDGQHHEDWRVAFSTRPRAVGR